MSSKEIYGIPVNIPKKPSKRFILGSNKNGKELSFQTIGKYYQSLKEQGL
jgi:hypothetical protein